MDQACRWRHCLRNVRSPAVLAQACKALASLALHAPNKTIIAGADGVAALVGLLKEPSDYVDVPRVTPRVTPFGTPAATPTPPRRVLVPLLRQLCELRHCGAHCCCRLRCNVLLLLCRL